jgi:hypothetical protein
MQDIVHRMKGVGISAIPICKFLRGKYGVPIMPVDVDSVSPDMDEASTMQETDELRGEIAERNEAVAFFTVDSEFISTRVACLTQTAEEEYNLRESGDSILLDGTAIDNHLRLDTFLLTILDRNCQIASGGIFFLGHQTSEVFQWVLATIFEGLARNGLH